MKRRLSSAISSSLLLLAAHCGHATILEAKDTQSLKARQNFTSPGTAVELSGLAMHSALVAEGMETTIRGDTMNVRVKLGVAHSGGSGRFQYVVQVPDEVRRITFGEAEQVIWSRPGIAPR